MWSPFIPSASTSARMNSDKCQITINVAMHMDKATSIRCHATHVFSGAQTDEDAMFGNFRLPPKASDPAGGALGFPAFPRSN